MLSTLTSGVPSFAENSILGNIGEPLRTLADRELEFDEAEESEETELGSLQLEMACKNDNET